MVDPPQTVEVVLKQATSYVLQMVYGAKHLKTFAFIITY